MTEEMVEYSRMVKSIIPPDNHLTNEDLVILIQDGINVNENLQLLFALNIGYIYNIVIVEKYSSSCEPQDLMQEAYLGLSKAVQRFDIEQGYKFMTYAIHWIKTYVQRYVQNFGKAKRIPIPTQVLISKYHKFKKDYYNEHQESPSDDVIAKGLEISNQRLQALEKCIYESKSLSIDTIIPGTEDLTIGESVADEFNLEESVLDDVCTQQDKDTLWGCVGELNTRCQNIIKNHYQGDMTLQIIAEQMNVSKQRVRQIERKGISYLKKKQEIQDMANRYGYDSSMAYRGNMTRFKNNRSSSTEDLALKRIEVDRKFQELKERYLQLTQGGTDYACN